MLKRNKALAIVLAFCFCMSFIAPALVAPSVAQAAAVDYSFTGSGEFKTSKDPTDYKDVGDIVISLSEARMLPVYVNGEGEYLSITLPSGMKFKEAGNAEAVRMFDGGDKAALSPDNYSEVTADLKTVNYKIVNSNTDGKKQTGSEKIIISLDQIYVQDASGEVSVLIGGPGMFPSTSLVIGNAVSSGSTTTTVKSVKTFGDQGGQLDDIYITENTPGTLGDVTDTTITLKLPNGFYWTNGGTITCDWGLAGRTIAAPSASGRNNVITIPAGFNKSTDVPGRIIISGAAIAIDDNDKTGDISLNVDGNNVTETDIVVAKYGEYGVTLSEDTVKEVTAGKNEVKIGSFLIEEDIKGSLIGGRTVTLDLPSGVKWVKAPTVTAKKGADRFAGAGASKPNAATNSGRTLKYVVTTADQAASKLLFEKGEVYIEPGFEGPIEIEVGGTAGVEGTVKVAEVKPAVTMKAEGVKDIVIGSQNQKVADILIIENAKGAILKKNNHDQIVVGLDSGYKFYKKPVVEVIEGDLEIDSTKLNSDNDKLTIKIKYDSTTPSTIKLSDVYVTGFRSAPEGPVKAILVEAEGDVGSNVGSTALDEGYRYLGEVRTPNVDRFSEASAGDVIIANCVTPADAGASISFKINSNIYTVNGIAKVMDVAPYIKGDRTYVPMRFLAETLGAEVVWDGTAQTVTLTKGDDVVVFTVGSTTYTVNGESMVADVAPEITNDRTMLPARYVAEAFGALVGWDAATQTVIVNYQ